MSGWLVAPPIRASAPATQVRPRFRGGSWSRPVAIRQSRAPRLRDAVGDAMDLIVEGNARFPDTASAVRMAEALAPVDPYWFEEPLATADRAYSIVQPDANVVGISGGRRVADLARTEGIELDEDAIEDYPYREGPIQETWAGPEGDPRPV